MQEGREVSFQTGKVDYNGQSGILCKFVTVTRGDKKDFYYILNDRKLDNGYYIVSTDLKEAIDPTVPRTRIGLIDKDANIIIPCENKTIKPVEGDCLLVERSTPQSQSVKEAVASRNDPAAATRMVSANASIKDKLNEAMNHSGKFVMNDLLSEGTLCTLDGKNLLNNQYFSFIGITNDSFCCSTNVPSDAVVKVARNGAFLGDEVKEEMQATSPVPPLVQPEMPVAKEEVHEEVVPTVAPQKPVVETAPLDVSAVSVPKEAIDSALNSDAVTNETAAADQVQTEENVDSPVIPVEEKQNSIVSDTVVPTTDGSENVVAPTETIPTVNLEPATPSVPVESKEEVVEKTAPVEETTSVDTSVDTETTVDDTQAPEEIDNLVHAVDGVVQENKKLKEINAQLKEENSKLKSNQEELDRLSQVEKENQRLSILVKTLTEQNRSMASGIQQMREVLAIDTANNSEDTVVYSKAA